MMDLVIDPLVAMLTDLFTASAFGLTELATTEPGPEKYTDYYCAGCDETRAHWLMQWTSDWRWLCWFCRQVVCQHNCAIENYCRDCRLMSGSFQNERAGRMRADWHRDPLA